MKLQFLTCRIEAGLAAAKAIKTLFETIPDEAMVEGRVPRPSKC